MKKFRTLFLSVILVLALCLGLVACAQTTQYTLTFEMNGHGEQVQAQKLGADEIPESPEKPSADGWRFDGWYEDEDFTDLFYFDTPLYEDTTVYAKWTRVYNVTFDTGVSDYTLAPQQVAIGKKVNLPLAQDIKSAGKKFEGWYTDPTYNSAFTSDTAITNNITLYAKWSTYYEVKFDNNGVGAANRVPQTQTYTVEGSVAEKPADMSVNTYKFLGWSLDKDGARGLYDFDTQLTDSITLYAQWIKVYSVSFNLNNAEALQTPPETESVEKGGKAEMPKADPVLYGWSFEGWYTAAEGGEEFDFENTEINGDTVVYAHWKSVKPETFDVETPEYTYREEAPYGERPDLDGFVIDGKMGEEENWEEQNWYVNGTTDAPTVLYKITTRFSEKGLYVFISVDDNGGLYHDGRNYYFKNSHLEFRIYDGVSRMNWFRIDTETLYPSSQRVKIAVNIAEGEVNTANANNKRAVMNVELFATWEDLQFTDIPKTVGIYAFYKYKRLASDNIKYTLTTPFDDTTVLDNSDYIQYDTNGYVNVDAENAKVGASSLNVAKTSGWDISHESDETNAYVSSNGTGTQAIFYKNVVETNYYEFEFELDGSKWVNSGKAGAIIYNSPTNYATLLFAVDSTTYDKTAQKFIKAKPYLRITDKDGKLTTKILDEIDVSATGKIQVKILFCDSYIYCILNDVLFHCEFVEALNVRTNPGLCTMDGGANILFRNYSAQTFTAAEAYVETAKYAYVISKGRLRNLSIDLNTTGVSTTPGASKKIVMSLTNSNVNLTNAQKNKILETGEIDSRITVYQLESLIFTVNGEENNIIDDVTDPETGAKWGEFVYEYPFEGNAVITNTSSEVSAEDLTYIKGTIVDSINGKAIAATATITSNNPKLGKYNMSITAGEIVLIVPKGYDYKISFNQTAYRTTTLDVITNVTEPQDLGEIKLVPNVLGGTAQSKKTSYSVSSSVAGWDLSNESDGVIVFETTKANPPPVYFSGYTINEYQYAKVSVTNVTDTTAYTTYEKDPAIGFRIVTSQGESFIGLRMQGLRYYGPNVTGYYQINGYGKDTCNYIDVTGEHKDTLEMLRMKRSLYAWINGVYMGYVELPEIMDGEAAIAVGGTFSYYSKIIYRDYEIKVGAEAVEIAKERVGVTIDMNNDAYAYNDSYTAIDKNKPLIAFGGLTEVVDDNDEHVEDLALAGNTITISRTEFASDDELYTVTVGSYGSVILSVENPSAKITLPSSANGKVTVSVEKEDSVSVTGRFVGEGFTISDPISGYLLLDNGTTLNFTTGIDGSFALSVPVSTMFTVKVATMGYVCAEVSTRTSSNTSSTKKLGDIALYTTVFGGKIKGTNYDSSLPYGTFSVGYDENDSTAYDGVYLEVEATYSNQYVSINAGTYTNFEVSFSLIRYQYTDRANESDPAFGLNILGSNGNDQILFHKDGVRSFPQGQGTVSEYGLMKYSTATSFGVRADFRIIRRYGVYYMYYKLESDEDWILIKTIDSYLTGSLALRFESCTSKALHFVVWNFNINALNASNIPDDIVSDINVNVSSGDSSGTVSLSGGSEYNGVTKFALGDVAIVTLRSASGYLPAYAKVNGEFVTIESNKFQFVVKSLEVEVEVVFEPVFETYTVTGKIAVDKTYKNYTLPSTVDIVAYMVDGRSYKNSNVAVGSDGSVTIALREGTFKMYAYSSTLASKESSVTISANNKDFGTITLCTMKSGNVVVNGVQLVTENAMGEKMLYSDGMLNLPVAQPTNCWLPEAVAKGNFVFATDIVQSGTPTSPYYSNDEVAGLIFSNGSSNTFSLQFWGDGLRISTFGYSSKEMLWPHINKDVKYFGTIPVNTEKKHNIAVKVIATNMMVYIDYKHIFTMTVDKGFVWADGVTGTEHYPDNAEAVRAIYAAFIGNGTQEIAIGFHCNLASAGSTYTNQSGFYNIRFTEKASLVSSFDGTF